MLLFGYFSASDGLVGNRHDFISAINLQLLAIHFEPRATHRTCFPRIMLICPGNLPSIESVGLPTRKVAVAFISWTLSRKTVAKETSTLAKMCPLILLADKLNTADQSKETTT
jgi:hypothetical protein